MRVTAALLVACTFAAGCGAAPSAADGEATKRTATKAPARTSSNVAFDDYAGSNACAGCHADVVQKFFRSPMHSMTRDATASSFAPWNGGTFGFKSDKATLSTKNGARFVAIENGGLPPRFFRVTKIIGGNYREDYAGIPVASADDTAKPLVDPTEEVVLPLSWLIDARAFRLKGYSVMVKERPQLREGPEWNRTCIFCHNTPPFLSTILGALEGPKARPYQGEVVDPLLPLDLRVRFRVTDEPKLIAELAQESRRIGGEGSFPSSSAAALRRTVDVTRQDFRANDLVEIGIGCEACHFGSRAHAERPTTIKPSYWPKGAGFVATAPERYEGKKNYEKTRACARCHQVLFSGYEPTWEGGHRHGNPGGSHVNSGEARDFLLGSCTTEMTCSNCHDPHGKNRGAMERLEGVFGNSACTGCHGKYGSKDALAAHTHHSPDGAGSACLDCHMPRKNMTLDSRLGRYHRIGSPTDSARVLLDRPLECALCHEGKTVESLVGTMEKWWNKTYDRAALTKLYGRLDAEPLRATMRLGKPHEQAVAYATLGPALGKKPMADMDALEDLVKGLSHPIPLLRGYAKRALEDAKKKPLDVDTNSPPEDLAPKLRAWLR